MPLRAGEAIPNLPYCVPHSVPGDKSSEEGCNGDIRSGYK